MTCYPCHRGGLGVKRNEMLLSLVIGTTLFNIAAFNKKCIYLAQKLIVSIICFVTTGVHPPLTYA